MTMIKLSHGIYMEAELIDEVKMHDSGTKIIVLAKSSECISCWAEYGEGLLDTFERITKQVASRG